MKLSTSTNEKQSINFNSRLMQVNRLPVTNAIQDYVDA